MELRTESKRPGMKCSIDVYYEHLDGFSEYLNDPATYKIVLVNRGSFVIEEDGAYRVIMAPVAIGLNERADFKVVASSNVQTCTLYFKPGIIREEFTIEALNSGKYEKFLSAVRAKEGISLMEKMDMAILGDVKFEDCVTREMIYQDAILFLPFLSKGRDIAYYTLTYEEYDALCRMFGSIRYELSEQPDNFWILRIRHFFEEILFMAVADFYRNARQDEIYKDPLVVKVIQYFWEHLSHEITLAAILREFSVNKNKLNDAFNKEVGMSCMAYLEHLRIAMAKKALQFHKDSVSEVSFHCGYSDTNYFSRVFKKHTGMTPTEFKNNMDGLC